MNYRAAAHEQEAFEKGMGDEVKQTRDPTAEAKSKHHEAKLADGRIGEDLLQVGEQRQSQLGEVWRPVVLHRDVHGAAHRVRDIGRAGDEQVHESVGHADHRLSVLSCGYSG